MTHQVFSSYRSETGMMRYLVGLARLDFSLTDSMVGLGSCTMKLNAAAEMQTITESGFADLHPLVPADQALGYAKLAASLKAYLAEITALPAISLQPNSGAQGEYAGLCTIKRYLQASGQSGRKLCLVPSSAHGTNPASAVMAGLEVAVVPCDATGDLDLEVLDQIIAKKGAQIAALMVTYPSTHGVFEEKIAEICRKVHACGGQVYMDGANFNALLGTARPGNFGIDVCHLNLHKTFCIPHGGGGPGHGPIAAASHLAPHLPEHRSQGGKDPVGAVAQAAYGNPGVLPISWAFIRMMGGAGLTRAGQVAILAANYIAAKLSSSYPILYRGRGGRVAHECILDLRQFRKSASVSEEDVAKRLADYGFHAPTMSFPVPGTLMIEPTESESLPEIDRFCFAMQSIRREIADIEQGKVSYAQSPLAGAPHSLEDLVDDNWQRAYSRRQAALPGPWQTSTNKRWPALNRIDNAYGDRNLICSCPSPLAYELKIKAS